MVHTRAGDRAWSVGCVSRLGREIFAIDEMSRLRPVEKRFASGLGPPLPSMMIPMGSLLAPLLSLSVVSSTVLTPGMHPSSVETVALSARGNTSTAPETGGEAPESGGSTPPAAAPIDLERALDPYGLRPSRSTNPGKGLTITSYVLGGVGTGLMVAGFTFLGLSMKSRSKVSGETNITLAERREVLGDIVEYDRNMTLFFGAGAGTLLLATIFYVAGRRQQARAISQGGTALRMAPWTGREGLGLSLRGAF